MRTSNEWSAKSTEKQKLADYWLARLDKTSLTPEQKREATEVLLYLLRARRASREAWAAIDKAMRQPLP